MRERRTFLLVLLLSGLLSVSLVFGLGIVDVSKLRFGSTSSTALVFVEPSVIIKDYLLDPGYQIGDKFWVHVDVSDVADLFTWQINMSWNPSILDVSDIEAGEFLLRTTSPDKTAAFQLGHVINATSYDEGYTCMSESILGDVAGIPGPDGGRLVSIEFEIVGYGYTSLTISLTGNLATTMLDSTGGTIIYDKTDGYFRNTILCDIRGPESPPGSGLYPPDGVVDGWDYAFVGLAFGKTSADPAWDDYKIADIRGPENPPGSGLYPPDGVVDGWDYAYCGLRFGNTIY